MNDEKLIVDAQRGDDRATNEILEKYGGLVKKLAQPYFLPAGDRDDLIQEGMFGLYKAVMSYKDSGEASFKTYASKVIGNELTSFVKRLYNHSGEVLRETDLCDVSEYSSGDTPESEILGEQERDILFKKLSEELSDFEREVIDYYADNYKTSEIADRFNTPQKSIDNALARAKRKMREKFEGWEEKR